MWTFRRCVPLESVRSYGVRRPMNLGLRASYIGTHGRGLLHVNLKKHFRLEREGGENPYL
jgi:hypothetical protein